MSKRAIIIVDLQKEYLSTGKLPLVGIDLAVANAARVIEAARKSGDRIIHVRHEGLAGSPIFVPGTEGVEILPAVAPADGEDVITKNYPNAFRETRLKEILDKEGIRDVTVIGAMSHVCIDATSRASADFGFETTVMEDACATRDVEFNGTTVPSAQVHAAYMSALAFAYAKVIGTNAWLSR
ncbi:cysteine hydrolase family protein [Rhizobium sp. LCM 4573]|uniref:cysteine hydrolase family protein n=1 Tax=Rhizobium sp. LCM 4573 TaxID=1848291 RepID=UPI0008D98774|nr:cysteine hydrolase family protein [Rhizobium sp. LCM 4573]OHV76513.1 Isochorismatase [Rhizobium sp. LCM 4573]